MDSWSPIRLCSHLTKAWDQPSEGGKPRPIKLRCGICVGAEREIAQKIGWSVHPLAKRKLMSRAGISGKLTPWLKYTGAMSEKNKQNTKSE